MCNKPHGATLLLVDNHRQLLGARAQLLEQRGYRVIKAYTAKQAKSALASEHVDVVLIDVRLENNDDENDVSGLRLAAEISPSYAKIILTRYPSYEDVKYALQGKFGSLPPARAYLAEIQSIDPLVDEIEAILRRRVFVAHGHDEAKERVARYLEHLQLEPIIVQERHHTGMTVLSALLDYTNVAFAVIVMTPEDVVEPLGGGSPTEYRARENVIFELGLFVGTLGQKRVRVLRKGDTHMPTDYVGHLHIDLDDKGAWKTELAHAIEQAGVEIDFRLVN